MWRILKKKAAKISPLVPTRLALRIGRTPPIHIFTMRPLRTRSKEVSYCEADPEDEEVIALKEAKKESLKSFSFQKKRSGVSVASKTSRR